jgi:DNA-binding IclR family transcriptional regulator
MRVANPQVKSATRAIEILEYFKLAQQPRTMSQIASDLGYPQSSTTVMLKTLVNLGYLNFDRSTRDYFPTPKLTALGEWIPRVMFGSGQMIDALNDLHAATGEGVFLGTKNDIYLQYTRTKESIHALRFHIDEGFMRPLTQSAAGWVLLSTLPEEKIDNIVRRANIATPNPADRSDLKTILARIKEIRANGYAHAENIPLEGGSTLALKLSSELHGQPVVLALGGVTDRFKKRFSEYKQALFAAAEAVKHDHDFDLPVRISL